MLRIAAKLRDGFRVELQAHRELFAELRKGLGGTSFISLWGKSLALYGNRGWDLLDGGEPIAPTEDLMLLRLDPHLAVLSVGFALPQPSAFSGQLQLFPALGVPVRKAGRGLR
jgi:hypothetical protein